MVWCIFWQHASKLFIGTTRLFLLNYKMQKINKWKSSKSKILVVEFPSNLKYTTYNCCPYKNFFKTFTLFSIPLLLQYGASRNNEVEELHTDLRKSRLPTSLQTRSVEWKEVFSVLTFSQKKPSLITGKPCSGYRDPIHITQYLFWKQVQRFPACRPPVLPCMGLQCWLGSFGWVQATRYVNINTIFILCSENSGCDNTPLSLLIYSEFFLPHNRKGLALLYWH